MKKLIIDFNYQVINDIVFIATTFDEFINGTLVRGQAEHEISVNEFTQPINWGTVEEYILAKLDYYTEFVEC